MPDVVEQLEQYGAAVERSVLVPTAAREATAQALADATAGRIRGPTPEAPSRPDRRGCVPAGPARPHVPPPERRSARSARRLPVRRASPPQPAAPLPSELPGPPVPKQMTGVDPSGSV